MKYLITGGAGFIGSHLIDRLLVGGHQVVCFDDLSTGDTNNLERWSENPALTVKVAKVQDFDALRDAAEGCDEILHLASTVGVDRVLLYAVETIQGNTIGTKNALAIAEELSIPIMVFSTSEVYGLLDKRPYKETDTCVLGPTSNYRWCYAAAKLVDEHLALAYSRERNLKVTIIRPFNVVGPRQSGSYGMVIPRFVQQALENKPLRVFGDGTQSRTFCHVAEFVEAICRLINVSEGEGEIFNVGATEEISIGSLAELVVKLAGSRSSIEYISYGDAFPHGGYQDVPFRLPNCEKLEGYINFKPTKCVREVVSEVIKTHRAEV